MSAKSSPVHWSLELQINLPSPKWYFLHTMHMHAHKTLLNPFNLFCFLCVTNSNGIQADNLQSKLSMMPKKQIKAFVLNIKHSCSEHKGTLICLWGKILF